MSKAHPFEPLISKKTKKLLVGTLPPESAREYFSNSPNTRLWDILKTVEANSNQVYRGSNNIPHEEKSKLLEKLGLGIADIIYKYDRTVHSSTKDKDIIPLEYFKLLDFAIWNGIEFLLFVYQNAYRWFEHSLLRETPVKINKLRQKYKSGFIREINYKGFSIKCILLPQPLNRGKKGETLVNKVNEYKTWINKNRISKQEKLILNIK